MEVTLFINAVVISKKNFIKSKSSKLLILLVLLLPFIGFFITKQFSDKNLKMPPHYIVDRIVHSQEGSEIKSDTIYHRMRPFSLVNQLKDTITLRDIDGSIVLVNFFQINDSLVSGPVSKVLKRMERSFAKSDTGLHILSISTDPVHDRIPQLRKYADARQVNHDVWWFLRGPLDEVKNIAENDFKLTLKPHGNQNKLSSPTLILLDRFQHVRGYYDGLDSADVRRCVHDVSLLMIEKEKLNGVER